MEQDVRKESISNLRFYLIAIIHLGVGVSVVTISSFVNAEMTFANWSTERIPIYLGVPILFELVRLFFSHLYDTKNILMSSLIIGLITSTLGVFLIPSFILPVGNFGILIVVSLFYFGSSILTTLIDSNLTLISGSGERSKIAGIIQILRLSGFALGGIVGSFLWSKLPFRTFINLVTAFYIIVGIITLLSVKQVERDEISERQFGKSMISLFGLIKSGMPLLMTVFLFLYPIGLFMQDLILEPFAIINFNFEERNVGRVVAIWTSLTLIFVPVGIVLANKWNRLIPILSGAVTAMIGLILFSISAFSNNLTLFYTGLVLFGFGNGISSAPAIGMMLDVCAAFPKHLSILLGFFGIMTTVGRSFAAVLGGIILQYTGNNYTLLFLIEAIILLLSYLFLIPLHKQLLQHDPDAQIIDPIQVSSIDLN